MHEDFQTHEKKERKHASERKCGDCKKRYHYRPGPLNFCPIEGAMVKDEDPADDCKHYMGGD